MYHANASYLEIAVAHFHEEHDVPLLDGAEDLIRLCPRMRLLHGMMFRKRHTSTFHGFAGPFPLDSFLETFTAVDIVDHTLSLCSRGLFGSNLGEDDGVSVSGDWGSLGGGVGLRLSCRMIAFGAKESASRCRKPRVVHCQHDEKIKSSWCVRTI